MVENVETLTSFCLIVHILILSDYHHPHFPLTLVILNAKDKYNYKITI